MSFARNVFQSNSIGGCPELGIRLRRSDAERGTCSKRLSIAKERPWLSEAHRGGERGGGGGAAKLRIIDGPPGIHY